MKFIKKDNNVINTNISISSKVEATGCNLRPNSKSKRIYTYRRQDVFTCNVTEAQLEYYFKYFSTNLGLKNYCELISIGFSPSTKYDYISNINLLPDNYLLLSCNEHQVQNQGRSYQIVMDVDTEMINGNLEDKVTERKMINKYYLIHIKNHNILFTKVSTTNDTNNYSVENVDIEKFKNMLKSIDNNNEFMSMEL